MLNSSARIPRYRRFTGHLAVTRARLAERHGMACSFAAEDFHLLPKHQLAWRSQFRLSHPPFRGKRATAQSNLPRALQRGTVRPHMLGLPRQQWLSLDALLEPRIVRQQSRVDLSLIEQSVEECPLPVGEGQQR